MKLRALLGDPAVGIGIAIAIGVALGTGALGDLLPLGALTGALSPAPAPVPPAPATAGPVARPPVGDNGAALNQLDQVGG